VTFQVVPTVGDIVEELANTGGHSSGLCCIPDLRRSQIKTAALHQQSWKLRVQTVLHETGPVGHRLRHVRGGNPPNDTPEQKSDPSPPRRPQGGIVSSPFAFRISFLFSFLCSPKTEQESSHDTSELQLSIPGRKICESGLVVGGAAHPRGSHSRHPGAIRVVLRDGQHIPAVQDLRRKRQGRQDRAVRALALHAVSDGLADREWRGRCRSSCVIDRISGLGRAGLSLLQGRDQRHRADRGGPVRPEEVAQQAEDVVGELAERRQHRRRRHGV
jgi:hypothetical protein